jgi:dihydrofolate reductase
MKGPVEPDVAEMKRREEVMASSFLIVARGRNGAIGSGADIPWRHKGDMLHFRNTTLGCALMVGRTTFDTLPAHMPGRDVVVVTSRPIPNDASAVPLPDFDEAVRLSIEYLGSKAIAFAGGPRIYEAALALPWMRRAVVTEIDAAPDATAFMPEMGDEWIVVEEHALPSAEGEPAARVRIMTRPAPSGSDIA